MRTQTSHRRCHSFRFRRKNLMTMSENPKADNPANTPNTPPPPPSHKFPSDVCSQIRYPNPPDHRNPDAATLREQWRFAIKQYSRWYSQAWGSAILAGLSFFALGWIIKGGNPLPSLSTDSNPPPLETEDDIKR